MKIPHLAIMSLAMGSIALTTSAGPFSTEPDGNDLVEAELVLEEGALTPGQTVHLGVVFRMAPEWHIYWRNAGDTGLPPSIGLELPDGVTAGPIQWPVPTWYEHAGLLDFIYENEVTLIIPLAVDAAFDQRDATIRASLDWLVCKEECLPGGATVAVTVPVGEAGEAPDATELFAAARARLPRPPSDALQAGIRAAWDGRQLVINAPKSDRLRFFAYEPGQAPPRRPLHDAQSSGGPLRIEYDSRIDGNPTVSGVLEVRRGGQSEYFTISIRGPRT